MNKIILILTFSFFLIFQWGAVPKAMALELSVSMSPDRQIKALERIGFECDGMRPTRLAQVECLRQTQVVVLNGSLIMLQCIEKRACWSEPLRMLTKIGGAETLSPIVPVTIYDAAGSLHLHCRRLVDDQQRQVCIESWRAAPVERNIRTTAWNHTETDVLPRHRVE